MAAYFRILACILSLFFVWDANALVIAGPITNPANGHKYYLLDADSWTNSEAEAQSLGGHLVTINDEDENNWVFETFSTFSGGDRNLWIGLNDFAQEGVFVWSSGEPLTYTNWVPGQPDNSGTGEDAVHIIRPSGFPSPPAPAGFVSRLWNDGRDGANVLAPSVAPFNGVVEVVPALTADFDGDGDVDGVDLAVMFASFNGPGGGVPANPATDLDGDGDADGVDLATMFGQFTGPLAPANVPEPGSLVLLVIGGMFARRRRI